VDFRQYSHDYGRMSSLMRTSYTLDTLDHTLPGSQSGALVSR